MLTGLTYFIKSVGYQNPKSTQKIYTMKKLFYSTIATIFFCFFLMGLHPVLHATHYMGGEITWECTPQGNFRFTMFLYRECYTTGGGAAVTFDSVINLQTNVPGFATIQMNRVSLLDISPECGCPGGPNITCIGMPAGAANMGAIHQNIYTSDVAYPQGVPLTGVPPATGWYFAYSGCCRNPGNNIQNASNLGFTLSARMYPFQGTTVNTCFDNSPKFLERPSTVICTGYPYTYNHVASDDELDSLVYEWAEPLNSNIDTPITAYLPGYSWNNPLPGIMHNPNNVPATLNASTGEIAFTSYNNGAFVTVTKVTAYKQGVKVAEIFRELQVVLLSCGLNTPPYLTPPFPNASGQYTRFIDTVNAGQHVHFKISGTNFQYCPNTNPPFPQTIRMYATGAQFDSLINPLGCLNPPCATLSPSPTWQTPLVGTFGVQTNFNWQTDCQHLVSTAGGGYTSGTYTFLFKLMDNFCPAPVIRYGTVTIVVRNTASIPSPPITCLEVLPNGDVQLTWQGVEDTIQPFRSYHLMGSPKPNGPYMVVDTITDIQTTTTIHTGADAHNRRMYYYLKVQSGCGSEGMAQPFDTARTIYLSMVSPGVGIAQLSWNPTHTPGLPNATGIYEIYRTDGAGNWSLLATTTALNYIDTTPFVNQTVEYRIEMVTHNPGTTTPVCRSISNEVFALLNTTYDQQPHENQPSIFPNPTNQYFVINPGYLNGSATLSVVAMNGATVYRQQLFLKADTPYTVNIPELEPGIYLVQISDQSKSFTAKLNIH
jgi:hypothetical protein